MKYGYLLVNNCVNRYFTWFLLQLIKYCYRSFFKNMLYFALYITVVAPTEKCNPILLKKLNSEAAPFKAPPTSFSISRYS